VKAPPLAVIVTSFALLFAWRGNGVAQVLFFDNFEQFGNGTDLSSTNYVPVSGPASASVVTSIQNGSPIIKATNFFGSTWAFFDNSVVTNKNQYQGFLSSVQSNKRLQVTWRMWIAATNSGPGAFLFSVPVLDPNPTVTFNPPLVFMDTGAIVAPTNGTSVANVIGNWGSLAGTIMTNTLILDYPNRTFSYSLNGQALAALPLGFYFTNVVGAIYFNGFERSAGSLGNRFAIDDVKVEVLPALNQPQFPSIHISYDQAEDNIQVDVVTIPTQQFWLTESADLISWSNHTFVKASTRIDMGAPLAGSHFFKLDPLYGQITWSATNNMPVARDQFTGGFIDGKLYVFGGNGDPNGANLSRMDIYDVNTGGWTRGADYDFGIEELTSAVVRGRLYIFGGWAGMPVRVNLCYDPATNGWSATAPKPTQVQATTAVAWGDEILTVGGSHGTVVEAYHTVSNTWRVVTQLPDVSELPAVAIHNDILYVIGGANVQNETAYNKVRRFELKNATWLPDVEGILPYPVLATYSAACPVVNGRLIIGGGLTTVHGGFSLTNLNNVIVLSDTVTIYDTESNSFSQNKRLPEAFAHHLFLLIADKLFAIGGEVGPFGAEERTSRMFIGVFEE